MWKRVVILLAMMIVIFSGCHQNDRMKKKGVVESIRLETQEVRSGWIVHGRLESEWECKEDKHFFLGSYEIDGDIEKDRIAFVVPFFYDENTSDFVSPEGALDLVLKCGDRIAARNEFPIRVRKLVRADGTTQKVMEDYIASLKNFIEAIELHREKKVDDYLTLFYFKAVLSTLQETEERFLERISLRGSLRNDLILSDALLHSLGLEETVSRFRELSEEFLEIPYADEADRNETDATSQTGGTHSDTAVYAVRNSPLRAGNTGRLTIELRDYDLAVKMEKYVILKEFTETFVHNSINQLGLASQIAGAIPGLQTAATTFTAIQNALSLSEFLLNKIVLSLMPSDLENIALNIEKVHLENGELTDSEIFVNAMNQPSGFTLHDWVGFLIAELQQATSVEIPDADMRRLRGLLDSFVSHFNDALAQAAPYLSADFPYGSLTVTTVVPPIRWRAEATTPSFYVRGPVSNDLMVPESGIMEWRASETLTGSTEVYVMPASGENARVIHSFLGTEYLGGPFGLAQTVSNKVMLHVESFILELDVPETINPGATAYLHVKTQRRGEDGQLEPFAGVELQISLEGGTMETDGIHYITTDSAGLFSTSVQPLEGSSQIVITVKAISPRASRAVVEKSVVIAVNRTLAIDATLPKIIEKGTRETLHVQVTKKLLSGEMVPADGVQIRLDVRGGSVSAASGITDSEGKFEADVSIDPDEKLVLVVIHARDEQRNAEAETMIGAWAQLMPVRIDYTKNGTTYAREYFSYDESGRVSVNQYEYYGNNPSPVFTNYSEFEYDAAGNFTQYFKQSGKSVYSTILGRVDTHGNIVSLYRETRYESNDSIVSTYTQNRSYAYDERGKIVSKTVSDGSGRADYSYVYDEETGLLVLEEMVSDGDSERTEYRYDENLTRIGAQHYYNGSFWYEEEYYYYPSGLLLQILDTTNNVGKIYYYE